ncbi:MAG: CPBP family intramembrane metalloprotease [Lachnospiraceae bacterium]|nr:CPBP family intramembrane metalloprotease [Lachnospiraceae bacterium]
MKGCEKSNGWKIYKKRISVYVFVTLFLSFVVSIPMVLLKAGEGDLIVMITAVVFMFLPLFSTLITKRVTKDDSKIPFKMSIKGNLKYLAMSAFLPGVCIVLGAVIYFVCFPDQLDLNMEYVRNMADAVGQEIAVPTITLPVLILIGIVLPLFAPFVLVNHVLAFGEEIGWRGYLLPLLMKVTDQRKAILISGSLWGLAHAFLVAYGVNYSGNYPGKPFSGIVMMIVFATVLGSFLSFVMIKTDSIIPACIAHGAINAIREAPLFIAKSSANALLGPKPSGIIGMSILILVSIWLMMALEKKDKSRSSN